MRSKFDIQLRKLDEEMILMGTTIEKNIQQAIEAFVLSDVETAKEIMERDIIVDKMQRDIERICFNLLIQQQPVAKDLRAITAAMKMVTDMERIGDHAADISEVTIMLSDTPKESGHYETIKKMAAEASIMLIRAVDSFADKDAERAREVIKHDDIVDEYFVRVKGELIELLKNDNVKGEQEIDSLMIAKYLERIADHATNIAEWVIYSLNTTGDAE